MLKPPPLLPCPRCGEPLPHLSAESKAAHERAPRQKYSRPLVLESATFETLALSCLKIPQDFECELQGDKSS